MNIYKLLKQLDRPALTQTPQASSQSQTNRANQANFGWRGAVGLLGSVLILQLVPGRALAGDTIEYTIYFLNEGNANGNTVRICDRIRPNQIFQPNGYGVGTRVQVQMGPSSVINLINANDASDRTQFIAAGGAVPTNCNITAANTDCTLLVDITGAAATGNPALVTRP